MKRDIKPPLLLPEPKRYDVAKRRPLATWVILLLATVLVCAAILWLWTRGRR